MTDSREEIRTRVRAILDAPKATGEKPPSDKPKEKRKPRPPSKKYDGPLPSIRIIPGEIERIVDESQAALMKANRGLYQRQGEIVSVDVVPAKAAHGREVSALQISPRDDYALREDLAVAAHFERYDKRVEEFVTVDPSMSIVGTLKGRGNRLKFRVLSGIIGAPTIRADGSILAAAGYDEATGLVFEPRGVVFPEIPERPTRRDVKRSMALLSELIDTFPFVNEAAKAVALSGILTICHRPSLPTAPMHGYSAPAAGTGKSKLVDIPSMIALGHEAPVISPGATEEEFEKRLVAKLLQAAPIIAIDNVKDGSPLEGVLLCQTLTQTTVSPRILGESRSPTLLTSCFVAATGNNLVVKGDLTRRTIMCRLDAGMENPETRSFEWDALTLARDRRGEYVAAALTILRAYRVAGMPEAPPELGSFEAWSTQVRGALIWAGAADPVETMSKLRESDPVTADMRALFTRWSEAFNEQAVTVQEIIRSATETRDAEGQKVLVRPELRDALMMVAGNAGMINARRLGQWLAGKQDRIAASLRVVKKEERHGVSTWSIGPA